MVSGSVTANNPASKPGLTTRELEELRSGIERAQSKIKTTMVPVSDALSFLRCTQAALDGLSPEATFLLDGFIGAVLETQAEVDSIADSLCAAATTADTALDELDAVAIFALTIGDIGSDEHSEHGEHRKHGETDGERGGP